MNPARIAALGLACAALAGCAVAPRGYPLTPAGQIELTAATLDPLGAYKKVLDRARPVVFTPQARAALTPSGALRAAINTGNPLLASRGKDGRLHGVSVDLAHELARQLMVSVTLVPYPSAARAFEGLQRGEWDVAFFAVDPARADDVAFTPPYLAFEGAVAVPARSTLQRVEDLDLPGVRVVVGKGGTYDLHLTRTLRRATLVRAATSPVVADDMLKGGHDAAAAARSQLEADVKRLPGLRILDGTLLRSEQAMAVPRARQDARDVLALFLDTLKESGFLDEALRRHAVSGARVEPAPQRATR
ncbi:MAG: transporter substrate-binding domain-containing protein [Betaproteobacteria bacterium]|nr:transporter substrate-binding domain-containing protein [Betaproteobacteria bacterium]